MKNKAFISYSHSTDKDFSPILQREIEVYAKKWYQTRRVRIFRDDTNLVISSSLWSSIENALKESEYFIYMASPAAANSEWVKKEINWWLSNNGVDKLLIVLTEGVIEWDSDKNDFSLKSNSIPEELVGIFPDVPLFLDLRWISRSENIVLKNNTKFINDISNIASVILEEDKDNLIGYHAKQLKYRKLFIKLTISIISILLLFLTYTSFKLTEFSKEKRDYSKKLSDKSHEMSEERKNNEKSKKEKASYNLAIHLKEKSLLYIAEGKRNNNIQKLREAWLYALESIKTYKLNDHKNLLEKFIPLNWNSLIQGEVIEPYRKIKPNEVHALSYSPDGKYLIIASRFYIRIMDSNKNIIDAIEWDTFNNGLVFSPKNSVFAASSNDGILIYNIKNKEKYIIDSKAKSIAFSSDGNSLYTSIGEVYDIASRKKKKSIDLPSSKETKSEDYDIYQSSFTFSPDMKMAAIGFSKRDAEGFSENIEVKLWDITRSKLIMTIKGFSNALTFSPDSKILVGAEKTGEIRLWNTKTGNTIKKIYTNESEVYSLAYSPDGKILAAGLGTLPDNLSSNYQKEYSGKVQLWNIQTGEKLSKFKGHSLPVVALEFHPFKKSIVSGSWDGSTRFWDINYLNNYTISSKLVFNNGVIFSPNGEIISALSSNENKIGFWDSHTGKLIKYINIKNNIIGIESIGPNNNIVILKDTDGYLHEYSINKEKLYLSCNENHENIKAIKYSSKGNFIIISNNEKFFCLSDKKSGKSYKLLNKEQGKFSIFSFSPNERILAIASHNLSFFKLWDTKSGKVLKIFKTGKPIYKLLFSPKSKFIAVTTVDGDLNIWNIEENIKLEEISGERNYDIRDFSFRSENEIIFEDSYYKEKFPSINIINIKNKTVKNIMSSYYDSLVISEQGSVISTHGETITILDANSINPISIDIDSEIKSLSSSIDGKIIGALDHGNISIYKFSLEIEKIFNNSNIEDISQIFGFLWELEVKGMTIKEKLRYDFKNKDKYYELIKLLSPSKSKINEILKWASDNEGMYKYEDPMNKELKIIQNLSATEIKNISACSESFFMRNLDESLSDGEEYCYDECSDEADRYSMDDCRFKCESMISDALNKCPDSI